MLEAEASRVHLLLWALARADEDVGRRPAALRSLRHLEFELRQPSGGILLDGRTHGRPNHAPKHWVIPGVQRTHHKRDSVCSGSACQACRGLREAKWLSHLAVEPSLPSLHRLTVAHHVGAVHAPLTQRQHQHMKVGVCFIVVDVRAQDVAHAAELIRDPRQALGKVGFAINDDALGDAENSLQRCDGVFAQFFRYAGGLHQLSGLRRNAFRGVRTRKGSVEMCPLWVDVACCAEFRLNRPSVVTCSREWKRLSTQLLQGEDGGSAEWRRS